MKYIFVINGRKDKAPIRGEIERQLGELSRTIDAHGDTVQIYTTLGEGDATRYVHLYNSLHTDEKVCFVACGGDGTINEVVSGIVGFKNKSLAVIAMHSNCDFIRFYPGRNFQSVAELMSGEDIKTDILKVNDSYSINVCNVGFDAYVADTASELMSQGKKNPFRKGILASIFLRRFNRISVVADGEKIGGSRLLLCAFANGSFVGGEFNCAPKAKNDDGIIDLCYLRTMSLLKLLRLIPKYKTGAHFDDKAYSKKLIYRRVKHVEVTSKKIIPFCLDGETLPGSRFIVDVLPLAVTLRLPKKTD